MAMIIIRIGTELLTNSHRECDNINHSIDI